MDDRDKFALSILPAIYAEYCAELRATSTGPQDEHWREGLAIDAYMMADAMLSMRSATVSKPVEMPFGEMPEFPGIRCVSQEQP